MTASDDENTVLLERIQKNADALKLHLDKIVTELFSRFDGMWICSRQIVNSWECDPLQWIDRQNAFAVVQRYLRNAVKAGELEPLPLEPVTSGIAVRWYRRVDRAAPRG